MSTTKSLSRLLFMAIMTLYIMLLSPGLPAAQEQVHCSRCGRLIQGTYYRTDEERLCVDCYQQTAPRCTVCGKIPPGQYWRTKKGIVCNECYQKRAPRCRICRTILTGKYYTTNEGSLCAKCFEKNRPLCCVCNRPLTGKYSVYRATGKKCCPECDAKYAHCKNCGIPVPGPRALTVEKGVILCSLCAKTAVLDEKQLLPIFRNARDTVKKLLNLWVFIPEGNIKLSDSSKLAREIKDNGEYMPRSGVAGLHSYIMGISIIYVLRGSSPDSAFETLAHEYAHVWQARHCPRNQELIFKEGFAEWVSYRAMVHRKMYSRAEEKLKETDAIYGEGLRKMLELERKIGRRELINYVKTHTSFGRR